MAVRTRCLNRKDRNISGAFEATLARSGEGEAAGAFRETDLREAAEGDATGAIWWGSTSWARGRFVWDVGEESGEVVSIQLSVGEVFAPLTCQAIDLGARGMFST